MGVFNFIETFFFISLGITFILILLLVYHFKQRLGAVEQKGDTMFDIMNNMVKEMGVIKTIVLQRGPPTMPFAFPTQIPQSNLNNMFNRMVDAPHMTLNTVKEDEEDDDDDADNNDADNKDEEDDDEEDDEDDEDNDDDDSSSSSLSDDDDSHDDDLSERYAENPTDDNIKVIVSDDENSINIEIIEPSSKIIELPTINIDESLANNEVDIVTDIIEVDNDDKSVVSGISAVGTSALPITENTPVSTSSSSNFDDYKKYSLSALKSLVLAKSLATDVSKMKKPQLLELLR